MNLKYKIIVLLSALFLLAGCANEKNTVTTPTNISVLTETVAPTNTPAQEVALTPTPEPTATIAPSQDPMSEPTATIAPTQEPTITPEPTAAPTLKPTVTPEPTATSTPMPTATSTPVPTNTPTPANTPIPSPEPTLISTPTEASYVIVIDPGHQRKGNYEKEPNGPGSSERKAKVSSGTQGTSTKIPEYELTLAVSLLLKEELLARGYEVIMTRETHDINISNVERAIIANEAKADAFIRVHADSSDNSSAKGVLTICQTKKNPYNSEWYEESKKLSQLVLDEVVENTGAKKRYVWETDTMTGINWTTVPTTILEMGFMSNPEEDKLMATEEYRKKIAVGVANAIDKYLKAE